MVGEELPEGIDDVSEAVIGAAVEVHRRLGPGLLERTYQEALAHELERRGCSLATEVDRPVKYRGTELGLAIASI